MNSLLQQILALRDQGLTHREIAKELQITIGKVRYQLYKKKQPELHAQSRGETEEKSERQIRIEDAELHPFYGEDRLALLPQGPTTIYAYWEMTNDRKQLAEEHFDCEWGVLPKVLRVYDVTDIVFNGGNAHSYKDVIVNDLANNWFIHELSPKRNYCVDFGTYAWGGNFVAIMRSNTVQLPAAEVQPWREHEVWKRPSETTEPEWLREFTGYSIHHGKDRRKIW